MTHFNFFVQGPDDEDPEEIQGGTNIEFDDALGRYTMDDVLTMREPITNRVVRCEHGWLEN